MEELLNHNFLNNLWQNLKEREPKKAVVELTNEIVALLKEVFNNIVAALVKTRNLHEVLPTLKQHLPNFYKEFGAKLLEESKKLNNLRDVIVIVINALVIEFYRIVHQIYELFANKLTRSVIYNYIHSNSEKVNSLLRDIKNMPVFNKLLDHLSPNKEETLNVADLNKEGTLNVADLIVPLLNITITPLEEKLKASVRKYGNFMSKQYKKDDWKDEYSEYMKNNDKIHWKDGFKSYMNEKDNDWEQHYKSYKKLQENNLPYYGNLEEETLSNIYYRHVIYTSKTLQIVLMSIKPTEEVGMEIHPNNDQFVRVEKGEAKVILGSEGNFEHILKAGEAVVVPANTYHNIINVGPESLQIYTIYSPPEHEAGLIEKYKSRTEMKETRHKLMTETMWQKSIIGPIIKWYETKNEDTLDFY